MNPGGAMLALKLVLVPGFLLLVTLAARRWGPALAGWLAGLPVVTGPILVFMAIEQGPLFAAKAAAAALSAVLSTVAVTVVYSQVARHTRWPLALALAFSAWALAAWLLSLAPESLALAAFLAALSLAIAPRLFPPGGAAHAARPGGGHGELVLRMLAGALLTLGVTHAAAAAGPRWSGLLAVFPVMSVVLAGFSHRAQGAAYTATLLRALTAGLSSFAMFCLTAALLLPHAGITAAFAAAVGAALATQAATMRRRPRS
jgi:hypothetical protein